MSEHTDPIKRCELVPDGLVHSQRMPFAVLPCGSLSPEAKSIENFMHVHLLKCSLHPSLSMLSTWLWWLPSCHSNLQTQGGSAGHHGYRSHSLGYPMSIHHSYSRCNAWYASWYPYLPPVCRHWFMKSTYWSKFHCQLLEFEKGVHGVGAN